MKKENNKYFAAGLTAITVILITIFIAYIIFRHKELGVIVASVSKILQPFLIGGVLAYLLAPLCNNIQGIVERIVPDKPWRKKLAEMLGIILSVGFAIAVIAVLLILIIPATFNSIVELVRAVPNYVQDLINFINRRLKDYPEVRKYVLSAVDEVEKRFESVSQIQELARSTDLLPSLQSMLSNLGNGVAVFVKIIINVIVGFIVSIYLLASRSMFAHQSKMALYSMFKSRTADRILDEIYFADRMFSGFLRGKILDSTIVGIICFVVLKILSIENALLISVIIGVTNIIPVFGPFVGAVPSALLIFVNDPKQCLIFVIFIVILQQVDGNILGPACMGSNVNLSTFWVLFAILFFGGIWGMIGMIVGVPLFAVIYDIVKKLVYYKLRKNGKEELIPTQTETAVKPPVQAPEIPDEELIDKAAETKSV